MSYHCLRQISRIHNAPNAVPSICRLRLACPRMCDEPSLRVPVPGIKSVVEEHLTVRRPLSPAYVRGRGRKTARSRPLSHDIVLAKNSPLRCCLDMKTTSSTALRRETHIAIAWHPMPVSTGRRMNILEKHLAKCGKYVVFPS